MDDNLYNKYIKYKHKYKKLDYEIFQLISQLININKSNIKIINISDLKIIFKFIIKRNNKNYIDIQNTFFINLLEENKDFYNFIKTNMKSSVIYTNFTNKILNSTDIEFVSKMVLFDDELFEFVNCTIKKSKDFLIKISKLNNYDSHMDIDTVCCILYKLPDLLIYIPKNISYIYELIKKLIINKIHYGNDINEYLINLLIYNMKIKNIIFNPKEYGLTTDIEIFNLIAKNNELFNFLPEMLKNNSIFQSNLLQFDKNIYLKIYQYINENYRDVGIYHLILLLSQQFDNVNIVTNQDDNKKLENSNPKLLSEYY